MSRFFLGPVLIWAKIPNHSGPISTWSGTQTSLGQDPKSFRTHLNLIWGANVLDLCQFSPKPEIWQWDFAHIDLVIF